MTFDLLEVVDLLTLPKPEKVAQRHEDGWKVAWVSHDPLLTQLHDAVWPSGERNGGSGGSKAERSPVDATALFEFVRMASQIGDWCRLVGVRSVREPVADLRTWYAASLSQPNLDTDWYARKLTQWTGTINRLLHPPKSFTPTYPCPVCGKREWWDGSGDGGTFPLVVEYNLVDGRVHGERATCRACSCLWIGYESVTELADELTSEEAV